MYTECPSCHTFFKVAPAHLKVAGGRVRCGHCDTVFDALDSLSEEVPASAIARHKQLSEGQALDPNSDIANEVELLDAGSDSLSDIEVPGFDSPSQTEDISLSGLADSKAAADDVSLSGLAESKPASAESSLSGFSASEVDFSESSLSGLAGDVADSSESMSDLAKSEAVSSDSSLSGLAGSEPVSEMANMDSLADLTGVSDLSTVAESKASKAESGLALLDEPNDSLSDLTMPTEIDSTVDGLGGKSDISSEPASTPTTSGNLSEINREIDNALDGLFEDDDFGSSAKASTIATDSNRVTSELLDDTVLSDIPDLSDGNDLSDLDLDNDIDATSRPIMDLGLDLSDEPEDAFEAKARRKKDSDVEGMDDFNLGDSLLDTSALDIEESDWSPDSKAEENSEMYSGDSFILEELDDDRVSTGIGAFAKAFWVTLIFLLILVLTGQFIYLKRDTLVQYPQMVPFLEMECQLIRTFMPCEVPERRAPDLVDILDRNVVSHPSADNALLITSTIKNTAEFSQPYPKMILTFSDINQKIIARRTFEPEEYLAKDVNIQNGMNAGTPVKIILEIVDPGEEAVNFKFDFK